MQFFIILIISGFLAGLLGGMLGIQIYLDVLWSKTMTNKQNN
jgi:hypothetical protein